MALQAKKRREAEKLEEATKITTTVQADTEVQSFTLNDSVGGVKVTVNQTGKRNEKSPGELRAFKDFSELDPGYEIVMPNTNDCMNFSVILKPDSGYWAGAKYQVQFVIPNDYPHQAPKCNFLTKIYHPNIDLVGNICLNILRADWKPVWDINAIILGLYSLMYEPNAEDPLNKDAGLLFRTDLPQFERVVKRTLQGNSHNGESFPRLI